MIEIYDEKENLNTNPSVAETNKVTADDMNQLREAVIQGVYNDASNNWLKNQTGTQINPIIPRYESAYAVAYLTSSQSLINNPSQRLLVNAIDKTGELFELNNNKIKALKDCVAIISGSLMVDGITGSGYVWAKLTLNDEIVDSNLTRISNADYVHCSIPTISATLKKGDTIGMIVEINGADGILTARSSKYATFISVAKI